MATAGKGLFLEVLHLDDTALIRLEGELDLSGEALLYEVLEPLCAQSGLTVELDLTRVTFVDSSGLHALVELGRVSQSASGRLLIMNPNDHLRRLFEITGVDRLVQIDGAQPHGEEQPGPPNG